MCVRGCSEGVVVAGWCIVGVMRGSLVPALFFSCLWPALAAHLPMNFETVASFDSVTSAQLLLFVAAALPKKATSAALGLNILERAKQGRAPPAHESSVSRAAVAAAARAIAGARMRGRETGREGGGGHGQGCGGPAQVGGCCSAICSTL